MIHAAIFGFGNIGSGVAAVLEENAAQIARAIPGGIHLKYILDIRDFPDSPYADRIVHDIDTILDDPEISVVCETMGGKEPACTFTRRALERGISVCSSNKELVEAFGPMLLQTAREHKCSYLFEASVGGGIPLLTPLTSCLTQEKITTCLGIMNGTTNYILTKMEQEDADYDEVLKEAQALGYAERNPTADVEGHDTGRKIAILSSLMSGKTIRYDAISVEGITHITRDDFRFARAAGASIKLLGRSACTDQGWNVLTAPYLVPLTHPLHGVNGVFNGILLHGNMVDDVMFYGQGAGKYPTGSAVVADMILASKNKGSTVPILWSAEEITPLPQGDMTSVFYVRASASDKEALDQALKGSIARVLSEEDDESGFYVFLTEPVREKEFFQAIETADVRVCAIRVLEH